MIKFRSFDSVRQMVGCLTVAIAALAMANTASAIIINGTATVSSAFTGAHGGAAATDPTDLNGAGQHIGGDFGAGISWLSGNNTTADEWIFVDLGAEFKLDEIEIWNYHEVVGAAFETNGRSVSGYELFVGGAGAALPAGLSTTPFTGGGGWTSINSGTLAIGPTTVNAGVPLLAATDTFSASNAGVRFIGIDVSSRHGADPFTTTAVGLAQIRVSIAVPEPATAALGLLGTAVLGLRRRRAA